MVFSLASISSLILKLKDLPHQLRSDKIKIYRFLLSLKRLMTSILYIFYGYILVYSKSILIPSSETNFIPPLIDHP